MTESILLVDDNPRLLAGEQMALEMNGFKVVTAGNGIAALDTLARFRPDLIVSDILMPVMDGFSLLEKVHSNPKWVTIPFLFLTALSNPVTIQRGRQLGADDFLTKPFSPLELVQAVRSRLERAATLENAHAIEAHLRMVIVMANAIEARDVYTGDHVQRVADYAVALARALAWPEEQIKEVQLAAILHDVGKVSVPDSVLNKADPLTPEEWDIMRLHPIQGCKILAPLTNFSLMIDGVHHHHERYDGLGYPDGLAGEDIPAVGRLMAVVDAYDAMTSQRPYRPGLPAEAALEQLRLGAGRQFDPHMADMFIHILK